MLGLILIKTDGVLGVILKEYKNGTVKAKWFVDGIGFSMVLESDEFIDYRDLEVE